MRTNILAVILFSFVALPAFATAPVVTSVDGASTFTTEGTTTIFGGFAGEATTCNFTDAPFSNCCTASMACATDPLCTCNENRAYDSRLITFTITTDVAGQALPVKVDGTTVITGFNAGNPGTSMQITWANLCTQVLGGASCEAPTTPTGTFRIYIDKDSDEVVDTDEEFVAVQMKVIKPATVDYSVHGTKVEGIGAFKPYPGDEKIYVEDTDVHTDFPNLQYGSTIKKVRVYMSAQGSEFANPDSSLQPADLTVEEGGANIDDAVVEGLENGTRYFFRIAMVDEAENIVQFFPSKALADAQACNTDPPPSTCQWTATPDQVLGLLTEDFNCFIASAAYGTSIEPKLDVFRKFRFKILLQRDWGREFVGKYYQYGPYAARYIHDKPFLRGLARAGLYPLYGFSLLSLNYGLVPATAFSLILLILLLAAPIVVMRRYKARA